MLEATKALIAATARGTLFIDCSTIDLANVRRAHRLAEAAGMLSVVAPVSGGTTGPPLPH